MKLHYAVAALTLCLAAYAQGTANLTDILISYRIDPWLVSGNYVGGLWVSPPVFGPVSQGGTAFTVQVRAEGLDAQGQIVPISPQWTSATPASATVSPTQASMVTLTVQRTGQSIIQVASQGVTKALVINATSAFQGAAMTVEITQRLLPPSPDAALRFIPVRPCRIIDTRDPVGPFGGPEVAAGTTRDVLIPSGACGVPASARSYSLNVTVVPSVFLGYLTVWPRGQIQPFVSTLNSFDGRVKANAAIVPAGLDGGISVFSTDATHVVLDINGYFVSATDASALAFYPLTPCRVADTRLSAGLLGSPMLLAGQARTFPILSSSCNIPPSARAYSLNFTVVPRGPLGFLTTWPTGQTQPLVSTLNAQSGVTTANAAIVPAGNGGAIDVFSTDATELVIDINGYFAPAGPSGMSLHNAVPCRVWDSRLPAGSPPVSGTSDIRVSASACGVASAAGAYVLNATVVPQGPLGFLSLWPQGLPRPLVSTLNALDGTVTSNMAIVPTSNGTISAFPVDPTHLVLDISGYFAP